MVKRILDSNEEIIIARVGAVHHTGENPFTQASGNEMITRPRRGGISTYDIVPIPGHARPQCLVSTSAPGHITQPTRRFHGMKVSAVLDRNRPVDAPSPPNAEARLGALVPEAVARYIKEIDGSKTHPRDAQILDAVRNARKSRGRIGSNPSPTP